MLGYYLFEDLIVINQILDIKHILYLLLYANPYPADYQIHYRLCNFSTGKLAIAMRHSMLQAFASEPSVDRNCNYGLSHATQHAPGVYIRAIC